MTATDTESISLVHAPARFHEHAWSVESRHQTSEGTVLYVRCVDCRDRRIDLQLHPSAPPRALSREIG